MLADYQGGDRYVVRSYFEPFVADTNWILLEASNAAGMDAAVAKFRQMLHGFPKNESATVPLFRELGFVKDQWHFDGQWTSPAEYGQPGKRSATEIAREFKGTPAKSGSGELWEPYSLAIEHVRGGVFGRYTDNTPALPSATLDHMRIIAAMAMNGCRTIGGRVHVPREDYGAMGAITGIEAIFQSGVLDEKEVNEFENFMTLSAAHPDYYWYDNIGANSGFLNEIGDRHGATSLLINIYLLDYVRNHCRMDERTRKEVDRRYEGTLKSTAYYINSYRDNFDTWELGETTMMFFYAMLYEGMPQWITNGNLRHAADMYILTSDNILGAWGIQGCYAGLDSYIGASPGMPKCSWHGRGLVSAAAFYLDDPQYRWFSVGRTGHAEGIHGSVGTPFLGMHWATGEATAPTRYTGVRSLPFDKRMYDLAATTDKTLRWKKDRPSVPGPLATLMDRAAFRDGFDPNDAYLFLAASQCLCGKDGINALQSNSIARFTDLGEIWLFTNTRTYTGWSRSMVSISNGKPYNPYACCTLEAQASLGPWSMISSRDHGVAGTDWTRTIVHLRGHYFAVLDRIEARGDDEYNMVCRWRGFQPAELDGRTWVARGSSGACMRIQATDPVMQTAENWENDGAARPFVLSQYKKDHLAKGQAQTFQNLMYVSGPSRPDEFTARRVGASSMLIKGKTSDGDHAALIGTGGEMPLEDFQTDAAIYCVSGDTICLTGATTLKARIDGQMREVFHSPKPANLSLDCVSGKALICQSLDAPGEPKPGLDPQAGAGQTLALFDGGSLPNPAGKLRALWDQSPSNLSATPVEGGDNGNLFQTSPSPDRLQRPLCRLTDFRLTASPDPALPLSDLTDMQYSSGTAGNQPTWRDTKDLEITLTFAQPTDVDRVRLVGILGDMERKNYARPLNKADDFTFSLLLSDDGFQKDIRKIDKPTVTFENTPMVGTIYYGIGRLPTWRIAVGQKARQIKVLPRQTEDKNSVVHDPGKGGLRLTEIEVYGSREADDLGIQAFAGDVNGDGTNELVVGTTNQQVAVYDSTGKRVWNKNTYPDYVYTMACDDLDGDGKADVILYTTGEKLYRYRGDGSAISPPADLYEAQVNDPGIGYPRTGGITAIIPWRPDPKKQKEIAMLAQGEFFVTQDNKIRYGHVSESRGGTWVHGLLPDEPDMLMVCNYSLIAWSSRVDANGVRIKIKELPMTGGGGAACAKSFAWARQIEAGKFRGVLGANEGGVDWYPLEAFQGAGLNPFQAKPGWHPGWGFDTGGVPVTAVLADDIDGDGVPEVFLARKDGFVNMLKLADGSSKALLNTGQPVLGICMLRGKDGKPRLAVATEFGVSIFGQDLKLIGRRAIPISAFVGPAGKGKDGAYVVDSAGNVTVLTLQ